MKALALAVVLVACGRDTEAVLHAPPKGSNAAVAKPIAKTQKLAALTTTLPPGWTGTYLDLDQWTFSAGDVTATIAPASFAVDPTPDDYFALIKHGWEASTTGAFVAKQDVANGFAIAFDITPADGHVTRAIYVLRHVGATWLDCHAQRVPNDAIRDQVIALCSSAKL